MACLSSDIGYLYNGTPTSAVVFHTVKGDLVASLSQTLCMNGVLQKTEKQNPGRCKCTTLHLPAGALETSSFSYHWKCDTALENCWPSHVFMSSNILDGGIVAQW